MKLSQSLKQHAESPAILRPNSPPPLAGIRAEWAYNHCPTCKEGMEWVMGATYKGRPIRWTWGSLWALACPDHTPWIKAAYDPEWLTWLDARVKLFRAAYNQVAATMLVYEHISTQAELFDAKLITLSEYQQQILALMDSVDPEMMEFDPAVLSDCLQRIQADAIPLSRDLQRARWEPTVS